jgi:hypothetical protein
MPQDSRDAMLRYRGVYVKCVLAALLMALLVSPTYSKDKKDKAEKIFEKIKANNREKYSRQLEIDLEQRSPYLLQRLSNSVDGKRINNVRCVSKTRCGFSASEGFGGLCLPGDRRVLMIQGFLTPNDMIAFSNEVKSLEVMHELKVYGFEYVELRSGEQSATFPGGMLDIPVE